jgi:hypothetical protein
VLARDRTTSKSTGIAPASSSQAQAASTGRSSRDGYGRPPLTFEANEGQTESEVNFLTHADGATIFLTATETVFVRAVSTAGESGPASPLKSFDKQALAKASAPPQLSVLRMQIENANPQPTIAALDRQEGIVNYLIGNDASQWHTNIPTYARVKIAGVYPGVDMIYYGSGGLLEYDFVIQPGTDTSQLSLKFDGADGLQIDPNGDLVIKTAAGDVQQQKPSVYQEAEGGRQEIEGGYVLKSNGAVGFSLGKYDASKPIVIDPVLAYSTYLGGSGSDAGAGIAVDSAGNVYVTGQTASTNFPTANPEQNTNAGGSTGLDAFVTKMNADGSALIYSTYLGGSADDQGNGIALDSSGNAYIVGNTASTNFPVANAFQTHFGGGDRDAFVTKLNANGSALLYSTYLGGGGTDEQGNRIAVDSSGSAYITGATTATNFPVTNAIQSTPGGNVDAYVTKFSVGGSSLVFSTYLGGSSSDSGSGIAVDSSGSVYVAGETASTNFPVTASAFQKTFGGGLDAFVTKLNATGSSLAYSTYVGGSNLELANDLALDSSGDAYIIGFTFSTNFPLANAIQSTKASAATNAFVTKLNASGTSLVYSTYLGGTGSVGDGGNGIAVDSAGNAYVTGFTSSHDFPLANAIQNTYGGGQTDAYVAKLNAGGSALLYSTYLGGSGNPGNQQDNGLGIAADSAGNAYVTGDTNASDFPVTPNAFQPGGGTGNGDAFISKIGSYAIAGRVIDSGGSGISGVTVTLSGTNSASATTDSNGDFNFLNTTGGGDYTVTPAKAGFTFSPPSFNVNGLNSNQDLIFVGTATTPVPTPTATPTPTFNITGQITNSNGGAGIAGVSVTLNGSQSASTQTDASGNYSFTNVQGGGSYTVFPAKSGFSFNPPSQSFSNLNSNVFANFIGTAAPTPTPTPTATPTPTPVTFQFSASSFSAAEGSGQLQVIVTRSGNTAQAASIDYATTDLTASDRGDYTTAIGTLRFAPGDTAKSFNVFITDDAYAEGDETFQINLSNPSAGAQIAGSATAMVIIIDNDAVTSTANPIDATDFFVRQHYVDFLNRAPDSSGFAFWMNNINSCGGDAACRDAKRIDTSAAFFLSIEFQQTGFIVEKSYQASFNRVPGFREFIRDTQAIGNGVVIGQAGADAQLEANKQAFFSGYVTRSDFLAVYGGLSNDQYVDALNGNTGGSLSSSDRDALVNGLNAGTETRATVLRKVAENASFTNREFNRAFVLMQYFGYLRRDPDSAGFNFWLAKLNSFGGDFRRAEMVKAFISSSEYRQRFGQS